jgi:probable F420-dependent oxidoreductase
MISDHIAVTDEVDELYPAPFCDPLIGLAYLAGVTQRVELGTTVLVVPYRHPLLAARMAACIDQLSGGRLIIGVGVGWSEQEFDALGLDFARRGAITDEFLTVMKSAWSEDVISFRGAFTSFKRVHTRPRPRRPSGIPIWVGGNSTSAMRRAIRFGDAWHPIHPEAGWLRYEGISRLRTVAEEMRLEPPAVAPRLSLHITDQPLPESGRLAGSGSVGQVRGDLDELGLLGVGYVVLDTYQSDHGRDDEARFRRLQLCRFAARELLGISVNKGT